MLIKPKTGICSECTDNGDYREKPLVSGLCGYHYKIELNKKSLAKKGKNREKLVKNPKTFPFKPRTPIKKGSKYSYEDQKFYRESHKEGEACCEECGDPIEFYSSVNCSHIVSRGANTFLRYEKRNKRKYCWKCHTIWGDENEETKKLLLPNTYEENMKIKQELTLKYYEKLRRIS